MSRVIFVGVVSLLLGGIAKAQPPAAIARFNEVELLHTSLGTFRGATESWKGRLVLTRDRRKGVGASYVSCIRIDGRTRNCVAFYSLPEGTIAAQGLIGSQDQYSLTLVGGTGVYLAYHGWVTATRIGDAPITQVGPNGQLVPLRLSALTFHLRRL